MQFIAIEVFIYLFTAFIFNYKALFFCVKHRACLKIAIPAYCFNIFIVCIGVSSSPLYHAKPFVKSANFFVIKYFRFQFIFYVKIATTPASPTKRSPLSFLLTWKEEHRQKRNIFLLENCTWVQSVFVLENYLFIRLENLKTRLQIQQKTFLREKVSNFTVSKWYTHLLTLNYSLHYTKRLSSITAR